MERRTTKSPSTKSAVSDPKNKQDGANKHLRLPRVKENQSPRPDSRRKPNPQRSRELFDKRPRNKNGAVYERYRSEVTSLDTPFSKQGGKKTSLNHLLNFTFPHEVWEGNGRRQNYGKLKHTKYNKELFLQANCQFITRDTGDYASYQNNPDKLVEWSLIEEICLPCHEVPSCPICLHTPVAAKITRCGHVYCWPCILHYLALTDKSWQKCPICFEAVHKADLKSVTLKLCKSFGVGEEITLCLMKREKGSLITVPCSHDSPVICTVNNEDSIKRYQKLLLASKKEILCILKRENKELMQAYEIEKETPEACFIQAALTLLAERENLINQNIDNLKEDGLHIEKINDFQRKHLISTSSTDSCEENYELNGNLTTRSTLQCTNSDQIVTNVPQSDGKIVTYFYQAEDGQYIYLHNINVRMLLREYGSLENAPERIIAKIVEVEGVSMTEDLRKRLRYLQHLPLTCEFNIVELDFSHIVTKETLFQFEGEISKRKHHRNRKARDERRREKMIEREENKKLGKYPKATYNLGSIDQFPVYNPDDFLSLSPPKGKQCEDNADIINSDLNSNNINVSYPPLDDDKSVSEEKLIPSTSFAQMLKVGPKNFTQGVKNTPKSMLVSPSSSHQTGDSDDNSEENPVPEFHQSFSDALEVALKSVTLQDSASGSQNDSKKKKKGKKQQLLFTTSMYRTK